MASGKLALIDESEERRLDLCFACPGLCRPACPVAEVEGRETVNPQRLISQARWLKQGRLPAESVSELPWHCTQCGACRAACDHDQDVPGLLIGARARVLSRQAAPPRVREVCGHYAVSANPYGRDLEPALRDLSEAVQRPIQRSARTVFLPGCTALARAPQSSEQTLRAASLLGDADLALTPVSSWCCGLPLLWAGDVEGFEAHAGRLAQRLEGTRVVLQEPSCAHALEVRYREVGVRTDFTVASAMQYLAELLPAEAGRNGGAAAVGWFESCHEVRLRGEADGGRRLARFAMGGELVEVDAACCGAGGLMPEAAPEVAGALAEVVSDAVREQGMEAVVVPSVRCREHLRAHARGVSVLDPADLLVRM